jgi:hypothetical protein
MEIFDPSLFLAMFPYLFLGSFPVLGFILITKWIANDTKKNRARSTSTEVSDVPTFVHSEIPADDIERPKKFYSKVFGSILCPSLC